MLTARTDLVVGHPLGLEVGQVLELDVVLVAVLLAPRVLERQQRQRLLHAARLAALARLLLLLPVLLLVLLVVVRRGRRQPRLQPPAAQDQVNLERSVILLVKQRGCGQSVSQSKWIDTLHRIDQQSPVRACHPPIPAHLSLTRSGSKRKRSPTGVSSAARAALVKT